MGNLEKNELSEQTMKLLRSKVYQYIQTRIADTGRYPAEHAVDVMTRSVESATAEQLIALLSFIDGGRHFEIVSGPIAEPDVIGITHAGCFIGIETDGYAHS